jgi:(4-(4-[2-(gamma-L-glutamylamino)ethyl]phenoxymethyl)furan-2-yl)methanamine synthase
MSVTAVVQTGSAWVIGWDVGGAHVKACLLNQGQVFDVAQWACPLWQGMEHLDRVLDAVPLRWPAARHAHHAVTMTGEMVDLFANRREGVQRIAAHLAQRLSSPPRFFAGRQGWCGADDMAERWEHIASANWLATARHAAQRVRNGVLVDIGSTTSDFIAFKDGEVHSTSRSDAQRLASGELVYHGVVRTPLCALARRIRWRDTLLNVMNEFFATSADVYRLTGELNPAHDLHPSADNGSKDVPGTQQRLARMVGLDAQDGTDADWLAFANAWRSEQVSELAGQLERVLAAHAVPAKAALVSAGCGDFLVRTLAESVNRPCLAYGNRVARIAPDAPPDTAAWAQVCAPSVAVAALFDEART